MSENSEQLDAEFVDHSSPELKMWAAVLHLAVLDAEPWIKHLDDMTLEQEMWGVRALNWLLSENEQHGSYKWVCHNLGLCHIRVRSMIGIADKKNIW